MPLTISQFHDQLRSGTTSCVSTVERFLQNIERHSALLAFIEVYANEALARAKELDAVGVQGPLHGVVVGIKDNICFHGHQVTASSRILEGYKPPYNATVVQRLLDAGAIIIGRQNCDEFGMGSSNENSPHGVVKNPADTSRVAGGSSGGSAAAVAADLCMISLGSDTGGSVRLPASHCGIVGFKPAYGRISRHGLIAYASSFDQIGILAHNPEDVETVLKVLAGPDEFDSTASQEVPSYQPAKAPYRIAYFREWLEHPSLDPEYSRAIKDLLAKLKADGHEVEATSFGLTEQIIPAYYVLTTAEASSNLARYDGIRYGKTVELQSDLKSQYQKVRTDYFGDEVKRRIMLGSFVLSAGYFDAYFTRAQKIRRMLVDQTNELFQNFDFVFSPVSTGLPPEIGAGSENPVAAYLGDIFTVFANLTGIPAISLPILQHSSNLTLGLQIHCSPQHEVSLLRFAHQLMQQ